MSEREWVPSDYVDEYTPPLRDSPSNWIVSNDDGVPTLATDEGDPGRLLIDGEIISFLAHVEHGDAVLTIADDLSWTATPPMPAEANIVWSPELEWGGCQDVATLVEELRENQALDPGTLELTYCHWSDRLPFRFDAATCSFVQVQS